MPPTENNRQGNQRILSVRNSAVEAENKSRNIKAAMQPSSRSLHPRTLMVMLGGNPSTQMDGLGSSFQSEGSNSMVVEGMGGFTLASSEAVYEDPGEYAPMGFMESREGFKSTSNAIQQWEGAGFTTVSNMKEVRYPEPQNVPFSQSADLSYLNHGTRKDSGWYTRLCFYEKWLIHIPQGTHESAAILKNDIKTAKEVMRDI